MVCSLEFSQYSLEGSFGPAGARLSNPSDDGGIASAAQTNESAD